MQTISVHDAAARFKHQQELAPIRERTLAQAGRFVATGGLDDGRAVAFLNTVFETAIDLNASDIHFEAQEVGGMKARLRVNNEMMVMPEALSTRDEPFAKAKLCSKASLNFEERLIPQDGRLMFHYVGRRFDVRIALTPTVLGYKAVCRLLDSGNTNIYMDSLDMPFMVKDCMKRLSSQNEGVFLMSGPTGSGKTTTLYAILQYLNTDTRHIITIENPVEYVIENFTQIEVNGNLTFAKAMKASLRLDPDVIMVGEIRDEESAHIAFQAGSTGHMMLSTVHANSAPATLPRLASLGVKPAEMATVLSAMVAQRLVRQIPPEHYDSIEWVKPNDTEREWLIKQGLYAEWLVFPKVDRSMMRGRLAIVEMIEMTQTIRELLESGDDIKHLLADIVEEAMLQPQFETLAQAGVRLAMQGKTTLQEVMQAAADIGYIPKRKRLEQILVREGAITLAELEATQEQLGLQKAQGKLLDLGELLVAAGFCSQENLDGAKVLAQRPHGI